MFVALAEVAPTTPDALGEGVIGGMVRCYSSATTEVKALEEIGAEFEKVGVRLVEFEWCVDVNEVEWEAADNERAQKYMAEANAKGVAVLSEFHVWTAE